MFLVITRESRRINIIVFKKLLSPFVSNYICDYSEIIIIAIIVQLIPQIFHSSDSACLLSNAK